MDYSWFLSENKTAFLNSFKMKVSVIVGIIHMLYGILNKGFNSLYFHDFVTCIFEFIP